MEQRQSNVSGKIFVLILSFFIVVDGQEDKTWKGKKISFFHRHHDCLISLFYKGVPVNTTLDTQGVHLDNVTAVFRAFGRQFVVDLSLNRHLFSGSYVETVFHSHGQSSETNHISRENKNCFYHGSLRFQPKSEAALSTCDGLSGYITDRHDSYHIEHRRGRIHRVYRNQDQRHLPFRCGTDGHDARLHNHKAVIGRHKRSIRAPYDSNGNTRYVELYLVNDYRTFERHGKNANIVIKRSQDIANIVSSLYRQLNIYVALVGVEVWGSGDLVSITTSADNTMENFLRYRKERINPYHHNDNAQLITGVFFDHGVVGKAIKGPICTHKFSGGVNMDYGGLVTLVATTVAHEMGHNFGMEHDNDTTCECRNDKCIMAATSGQISPRQWSSCSQNALAEAFDLGMDYCLQNVPSSIYRGPVCGNGFKEDGEECDCGLPQDCTNRCCNASTCRLHSLAQCATGMCCDLGSCKMKGVSSLCRKPVGECDLAEFCNGTSEYCPIDVHTQNGIPCKGGQSYCYNGQCNTPTDQCKLLWGESGRVSDPICFQQLNMNGNSDGNCGYNWTTDKYKRCEKEDVMCGLLHCVHLNEKLMFWRDNLAIAMRASFLSRGNDQYVCRSAMLDVGLDMPDPGFVPDGSKCERDKICVNSKCVALAKLRVKQCPKNCHGHGVCNSNGNCHCSIGYAPPFCDRPGYGGSLDSGPASNEYDTRRSEETTKTNFSVSTTNSTYNEPSPGANKDLLIGLLVVFLLVVPILILAVIAFLNRRRLMQWWKVLPGFKYRVGGKTQKRKATPQPPQPNPSIGQSRKDFEPPRSTVANPLLQHSVHSSDVHAKPKVWNPSSGSGHTSVGVTPPLRPSAPVRPSALVKSNSSCDSKSSSKKVRLSIPIQETEGPPPASSIKPTWSSPNSTSTLTKQDRAKDIPQSPKAGGIVKRESFRGSEISDPVLICTTSRNSLVLADGNVDIIGPEAKLVSRSPQLQSPVSVKRSQSDRPVSKPDKTMMPAVLPQSATSSLRKSALSKSPTRATAPVQVKPNLSGFVPRPVPPIPCHEDDTQPVYTNQSDMGDLLDMIKGALADSNIYNNMDADNNVHKPIQETNPPELPKRPVKKASGVSQEKKTSTGNPTSISTAKTSDGYKCDNVDSSKRQNTTNVEKRPLSAVRKVEDTEDKQPSSSVQLRKKTLKGTSNPVEDKSQSSNSETTNNSHAVKNGAQLRSAISEDLKNKILSRSDSSSPACKPATKAKPSFTPNADMGGKPSTVQSSDLHKPTKPGAGTTAVGRSRSMVSGNQRQQNAIPDTLAKPLAPSTRITGKTQSRFQSASTPNKFVSDDTVSETTRLKPAERSLSSASTAATVPKVSFSGANRNSKAGRLTSVEEKPAHPAISTGNSSVSSLAAKFGKSADDSVNTPSVRTVSTSKKMEGSQALKSGASGEKPEKEVKPVSKSKSIAGATRPTLPPKPGAEQGGAAGTTTKPTASVKRVHSYRF